MIVEAPRNLKECIVWEIVRTGTRPELEEEIQWKGPTKEPFLSMWTSGWRKWKARHEWQSGKVIVIHFWLSPSGERQYLKVKN